MDEKELMAMFGLDESLLDVKLPKEKKTKKSKPVKKKEIPKSVLKLDKWTLAKGKEIHRPWQAHAGIDEIAMADFFGAAFQREFEVHDVCVDMVRHAFIAEINNLPDNEVLREMSKGNVSISTMTAEAFAKQFKALLGEVERLEEEPKKKKREKKREEEKEREEEEEDDEGIEDDGDDESDGPDRDEDVGEEKDDVDAHDEDDELADSADEEVDPKVEKAKDKACHKAARKAVKEAVEDAEKYEDICHAVGMGPGTPGAALENSSISVMYNRIKNNPMLRRIFEHAGRNRRLIQSTQRQKTSHGYEDMVGICLDDNLSNLIDEELMLLVDDDFGLDAMRRFAEKETLARDYRGVEHVGKGPIMMSVDTSGSMQGEPVEKAKGMALSIAWMAKLQKRWCVLINYSGSMSKPEYLVLRPERWDYKALCDWLVSFEGCGSSLDIPVQHLPRDYYSLNPPKGKVDLIMGTDAACHIPPEIEKMFNDWKKREKVRCISLVLGSSPESLKNISDECYKIMEFDGSQEGVQKCFTI